jgi:hypothetical protein
MKQWVLGHDRFIAETVQDEWDLRARLPHERPGLVRLGWLALQPIPGGVLLDKLDDLGDARSRAVVLHYLAERGGVEVWYRHGTPRVIPATATTVRRSRDEVGQATFEEDFAAYIQAVRRYMTGQLTTSGFPAVLEDLDHLGSGPLRDAEMASREDMRLRGYADTQIRDRHTASDIRNYLALYGYTNTSGTVGRWHHQQLQALRGNVRG